MSRKPSIAVAPATRPPMHEAFVEAVRAGGGEIVPVDAAEALVWADPARADDFPAITAGASRLRWVQLPFAGIETFAAHLDERLVWTCGKGVYARPVAEHALGLMLAGLRGIGRYARAERWSEPLGRNLLGARVTVLGGGGIAAELVTLLAPFECDVTIVRRHDLPLGTATVVDTADMLDAVAAADAVVLALALTAETRGVVDAGFLTAMQRHAWLINVARGAHVVTDDLVEALEAGDICGAALDVTDPEPLPQGHALWRLPNCIVTPHIGNTPEMGLPLIAAQVRANVAHFAAGEPLEGLVDVGLGY